MCGFSLSFSDGQNSSAYNFRNKTCCVVESANVRAIYSGLIEVPPLKLKPFSAGISIDNGDPATKNVKSGKKIKMASEM